MVGRLGEDHANARMIAEQLAEIEGIAIDPLKVRTNIVFFEVTRSAPSAPELAASLRERGVLVGAVDSSRIRVLTHHDVSRDEGLTACRAIREVMEKRKGG
jgi:threonine aldolase